MRLYALWTRQLPTALARQRGCPASGWVHAWTGAPPWLVLVHTEPEPLAELAGRERWSECRPMVYTGEEPMMWLRDYVPQNVKENLVPISHLESCRNLLCTDPVHDERTHQ